MAGVSAKRRLMSEEADKRRAVPRLGSAAFTMDAMAHRPAHKCKALCAIIAANSDPHSAHDLQELRNVAKMLWQRASATGATAASSSP
eukprot:6570169-Heterocapsa_arctica.AAC.1